MADDTLWNFTKKYFCALKGATYLFSVGVLTKPENRDVIARLSKRFGYPKNPEKSLPTVDIYSIVNKDYEIVLPKSYDKEDEKSYVHIENVFIDYIMKKFKPKTIFEMGTWQGITTLNMAQNTPKDTKIITIDLPQENIKDTKLKIEAGDKAFINKKVCGHHFLGTPSKRKIKQVYGDTAKFDFSPYYGKMDLVYVDASHAYDYVKNDTEVAFKLLKKKGGIIMWHDYFSTPWPGVSKALNEYKKKDKRFKGIKHIAGTKFAFLKVGR